MNIITIKDKVNDLARELEKMNTILELVFEEHRGTSIPLEIMEDVMKNATRKTNELKAYIKN